MNGFRLIDPAFSLSLCAWEWMVWCVCVWGGGGELVLGWIELGGKGLGLSESCGWDGGSHTQQAAITYASIFLALAESRAVTNRQAEAVNIKNRVCVSVCVTAGRIDWVGQGWGA
jgi:hypothetical protein